MGCTRALDRVYAATGAILEAPTRFEHSLDVPHGGSLWSIPSLLSNGLLRHHDAFFRLPAGFYSLTHIFILLALMALCRIKTIEQLRYCAPGEFGKLIGLDRIPEVRTLREKVQILSDQDVYAWAQSLSDDWMGEAPDAAGVLYVDGRVCVYHGSQTKLPRRYVSRERLCLRGLTDYWVNDRWGRPFFVVSTPLTSGLLSMLREEIVDRLLVDVPGQFGDQELMADPWAHRFVIIFDREGYSPDFFKELWEKRIACQTYHKYPDQQWGEEEFENVNVAMPNGEVLVMPLAERGTRLSNGMWMREIRKLTASGRQTSILSSDYIRSMEDIAAHMFTRWTQENFFKYMDQNFDLDRLASYKMQNFDETKEVVNPLYRQLESKRKKLTTRRQRKQAQFAELTLKKELSEKDIQKYEIRKTCLRNDIMELEREIESIKDERKKTPRKIPINRLPEPDRFKLIAPARKQFLDTIKMIAYRAETAMAMQLRDHLARTDDARSLLREIYSSNADIIPDLKNKTLTIKLHHLANPLSDKAAQHLAQKLNETESNFPGTEFRMVFKIGIK
jgi:hypothetical protein